MVGLAPSAAAAEVLADSVGIGTENTAKWLHESLGPGAQHRMDLLTQADRNAAKAARRSDHDARAKIEAAAGEVRAEQYRWSFHRDQLVIVDEASLAGTFPLAALAGQAHEAGAKLLLVGDDAQLSAIETGGAFRMIATQTKAVELCTVWRFHHEWEKKASLDLRVGNSTALAAYTEHDRIKDGDQHDMLEAAYQAWWADVQAGKRSLLIAADNATVAELNTRARLDRLQTDEVTTGGTRLHDGTEASVGDRIITRRNARTLTTSDSSRYVRNGDAWTITRQHRDGSLSVLGEQGAHVRLPAEYIAGHVELGYAMTAHRAEGATVDTTHLLADEKLSREVFYVGMTRGQEANHAYVITAYTDVEQHQKGPQQTGRQILEDILARESAEKAAHDLMRENLERAESLTRLVPIHDYLAQTAAADHYDALLRRLGLAEHLHVDVVGSRAYGPLVAALRHAEAQGLHAQQLLNAALAGPLDTARDTAAVLHARVDHHVGAAQRHGHTRYEVSIVGIATPAPRCADLQLTKALADTEHLITQRADWLAERAVENNEPWLQALGNAPSDPADRAAWETAVAHIAAYRELHHVNATDPLGPEPPSNTHTHIRDRQRAAQVLDHLNGSRTASTPVEPISDPVAGHALSTQQTGRSRAL